MHSEQVLATPAVLQRIIKSPAVAPRWRRPQRPSHLRRRPAGRLSSRARQPAAQQDEQMASPTRAISICPDRVLTRDALRHGPIFAHFFLIDSLRYPSLATHHHPSPSSSAFTTSTYTQKFDALILIYVPFDSYGNVEDLEKSTRTHSCESSFFCESCSTATIVCHFITFNSLFLLLF